MLKLPKFPIKVQSKDGEKFVALFKSIGHPTKIKVVIKLKGQTHQIEIPAPKQEDVFSWGGIARRAFADLFPPRVPAAAVFDVQDVDEIIEVEEETNGPAKRNTKKVSVRQPSKESAGSSQVDDENSVLRNLRSRGDSAPVSTANLPTLTAREALPGVLYLSATSKSRYLCRYEGMSKNMYVLQVYFHDLKEWRSVEVKGDYKLMLHPNNNTKETKMPTKKFKPQADPGISTGAGESVRKTVDAPEAKPVNSPKAVTKKGLTVYEAWGQAFAAHATKKDAPEQIVKAMEASFPGRKTLWAKWVNPVRARYNAGKLPGVDAPTEKIAVYAFDGAPKRAGKERRTPPLKSIRKKIVTKVTPGPKNMKNAFKIPK